MQWQEYQRRSRRICAWSGPQNDKNWYDLYYPPDYFGNYFQYVKWLYNKTFYILQIVPKVVGWIIQVLPIFIILRPRPRTYASTSPLLLLQLHQQQQLLSINIINSTNHHLQHAKLRILRQHLTSHAAYERSGGPPKRPAAKRPCVCNFHSKVDSARLVV